MASETAPPATVPPAIAADRAGGFERVWRRVTQGEVGSVPVVVALILIWTIFQILNPHFLSPRNLTNLMVQIADIGVISIGIVLVLLLGEIDLSVGSISGLGAGVVAVLNVKHGIPAIPSVLLGILTGTVLGFLQGFWFTRFKIPSFVVTLAGLLAWEGALILILGTTGTINVFDPGIDALAGNFLTVTQGWVIGVAAIVAFVAGMLLTRRRRAAAGLELGPITGLFFRAGLAAVLVLVAVFILNSDRGVPFAALILVGLVVVFDYIIRRTPWGRHVLAVGGNAESARRAGISVTGIRLSVFTLAGSLAAFGGIIAMSRVLAVSQSSGGGDVLLNSIAAAVIGGTSLFGGRGTIWSALTGALVIGSINNGLDLLALSAAIKFMVTGGVLLAAVTVDAVARQGRQSAGRA
ncbi:MAG: sugar ABC transporter permease [Candidatus Dormibacteraeota bacterium]|nr:sugar ABC transporter permease [Candidatus Dormibacteraeota bacterium]